ncbi:hypothetical protein OAO87_02625, partial [bacterium]|nr:hypothetical protein [bacterium]
ICASLPYLAIPSSQHGIRHESFSSHTCAGAMSPPLSYSVIHRLVPRQSHPRDAAMQRTEVWHGMADAQSGPDSRQHSLCCTAHDFWPFAQTWPFIMMVSSTARVRGDLHLRVHKLHTAREDTSAQAEVRRRRRCSKHGVATR